MGADVYLRKRKGNERYERHDGRQLPGPTWNFRSRVVDFRKVSIRQNPSVRNMVTTKTDWLRGPGALCLFEDRCIDGKDKCWLDNGRPQDSKWNAIECATCVRTVLSFLGKEHKGGYYYPRGEES